MSAMRRGTRRRIVAACAAFLLAGLAVRGQAPAVRERELTALDRYVASPDPSYKFALVRRTVEQDYTWYVIDLTSQTWRSASEVDRPVWRHWLTIIAPNSVETSTALLFIGGGSNKDPMPDAADKSLANIAVTTRAVVAELGMVPNQPLTFAGEGKPRSEDAMVAYTWDKFLRTGDDTWPARLPMTKAAVRAMDTVTSFLASDDGGHLKVDTFVVAGASKRGWTTWTTAAVDKRVVAIVPIVIDVLNLIPSMEHHFAAYGYWAPAVSDYESLGIMKWLGSPQYAALMHIEEPYEYRSRMTMPKFLINATDDQFFLPDSSQFYFDSLPGVKYLRYVPNADHSLRSSDAPASLLAAFHAVVSHAALPKFQWRIDKDGTIRVKTTDAPTAVKLWQITNPGARDFRLTTIGPRWTSADVPPHGTGEYVAKVSSPPRGWTAYFVELTYTSGLETAPFIFTTGVKVVPDAMPFLKESQAIEASGRRR